MTSDEKDKAAMRAVREGLAEAREHFRAGNANLGFASLCDVGLKLLDLADD